MKVKVEDMSCDHCKMTITNKLIELMSPEDFEVSLGKKEVTWSSDIDPDKIKEKIREAGYHPE